MATTDHFHLDAFQGTSTGVFSNSPHSYGRITFLDENRQAIRIADFVKKIITKNIQKSKSLGTLDANLKATLGIDEMLDSIKKTGVFKSSVIIPQYTGSKSLTVLLKRKSPYYFSMQQTFNTEGHITLSYSGGLRNLGGMLDTLSFSYEKSLQRDKLAQVNFNWSLPFFFGNTSLDLGYYSGSSGLDNHIIEKRDSVSIKFGLPHNQTSVKYSIEDRQNLFDPDDVSRRVLLQEVTPTLVHKFEIATQYQKSDTSQTDLKLTQTQGDVLATSLELDWKVKYSLASLMKAHWPKKYTQLTFENLFMVKTIPLGYDLRINDTIHFSQLRGYNRIGQREPAFNAQRHPRHQVDGFRHQGDHVGSRFGLRNTSKVIFDGYPYLKDSAMLKTFLHFTTIVTDPNIIPRHPNISMASGIGIDLAYGPAHIEFLYNYWHKKNKDDQRNYFQVKFAFGD